jgi:hypothetical protein
MARWKCHIRDAASKNRCRQLNQEIRSLDITKFHIRPILTCKSEDADKYEVMFITQYNTYNNDGKNAEGLNIRTGGNAGDVLSEDTRLKMSEARSHYAKTNPDKVKHTDKTKKQISESLIDNVVRYDHDGKILPKYIKYVNWNDRRGYQIVSHPLCKCKYFVSSKEKLAVLYDKCLLHLESLAVKLTNVVPNVVFSHIKKDSDSRYMKGYDHENYKKEYQSFGSY